MNRMGKSTMKGTVEMKVNNRTKVEIKLQLILKTEQLEKSMTLKLYKLSVTMFNL